MITRTRGIFELPRPATIIISGARNVWFWPKADMLLRVSDVRFRG